MWLPCNFLETIRARIYHNYEISTYQFFGLGSAPGGKVTYLFSDMKNHLINIDYKEDLSYWPRAFNNLECVDISSLHDGEIELTINLYDVVQYNQYFFDTKSRAEGKLVNICLDRKQQKWRYTFMGSDGLAKYFYVPELLIREPFRAYADDPLLQ